MGNGFAGSSISSSGLGGGIDKIGKACYNATAMSVEPTFTSVAEFREYASNHPDFTPSAPTRTKLVNPVAYTYRRTHQVVFGYDKGQQESVEVRITHPEFAVTPSTGAITKFSPNILQRLTTRDAVVETDIARSANVDSGPGWMIKPTESGAFVFISTELPADKAEQIRSILTSSL